MRFFSGPRRKCVRKGSEGLRLEKNPYRHSRRVGKSSDMTGYSTDLTVSSTSTYYTGRSAVVKGNWVCYHGWLRLWY